MTDCAHDNLLEIYHLLLKQYGPRNWWPADSPFEVCVGAILTQNTNWENVEKAINNLKREGLLSPEGLRDVSPPRLAEVIKPAGYFNVKSSRLKDFVVYLFARHNGCLDAMFSGAWQELRRELLAVRGIGPETCDSIMLYAGNKPTFVVDTYTKRLFSRLGIFSESTPYETVRGIFMNNLPAEVNLYNEYHALVVQHCKEYCRKQPFCEKCPVNPVCKFCRRSSG
jgi:endonuclease-3 related protein